MLDRRASSAASNIGATTAALDVRLAQDAPVPLDVTLTCGGHELLALIGPSGSGKTTVLQTIAGLRGCHSGRISTGSDVWLDAAANIFVPPQHRGVGLVFQDYALFPHLTAVDNVAIAMGEVSKADARAQAHVLLERMHLKGLGGRRPQQLSGGERQRVAMARALARTPRVLLLDEPFSAVDRMTRVHLRRDLQALKAQLSIPIVLVTHDIDEALQLADRVTILDGGRTVQSGTPDEVRAHPVSARVAAILGA